MLVEHHGFEVTFSRHVSQALRRVGTTLVAPTFVRPLFTDGRTGATRDALTQGDMSVDDAVHVAVLVEDDALALTPDAWLSTVGDDLVVAYRVDAKQALLPEAVEVRFASARVNGPLLRTSGGEVANSLSLEGLVGASSDEVIDDLPEVGRDGVAVPRDRLTRDDGGAREVEL